MSDQHIEALAALEHERWAHWMEYLFACCVWRELSHREGESRHEATIPTDKVERWQRRMETKYADLTEKEKESDRVEARKTWALLQEMGWTERNGHGPCWTTVA